MKVTHLDGHQSQSVPQESPDTPSSAFADWQQLPQVQLGSPEEEEVFQRLQETLPSLWHRLMQQGHVEQTVVVVPSLTLDPEELRKLHGPRHYEERLFFLMILLSLPKTKVIFITTEPISEMIIDYYLQLLPGIPFSHARSRLMMFATYDTDPGKSLTQKILERPNLLRRIRRALNNSSNSHLTVFNVTPLEKSLAVALGIPLLGPDPKHLHYGSKSGCRKLFKQVGIPLADGYEDLKSEEEIYQAIYQLRQKDPDLKKVVIKINEGFSGEGNAIFSLVGLPPFESQEHAYEILSKAVPERASYQADTITWETFIRKFCQMEGIVECFLDGEEVESPSIQLRITPLGEAQIISTHDQKLGGPDGQVYIGCSFPATPSFKPDLHHYGQLVGDKLAKLGIIGRLSLDFLFIRRGKEWFPYAVEINLRKGGTTHPFRTLQFLTGGRYNQDSGVFASANSIPKYYFASDNIYSPKYQGTLPQDLLDITTYSGLHYNSSSNTGVIFHMIGALSEFGKLGATCIGDSPQEAEELYHNTLRTLDEYMDRSDWINHQAF